MYCRNCGASIPDNAPACPSCNAVPSSPAVPPQTPCLPPTPAMPPVAGAAAPRRALDPARAAEVRKLIIKAVASVAAIIFGVLALTTLMRFVDTLETVTSLFSSQETPALILGIVCYVVCGLLLALFAALACIPLIHAVLEPRPIARPAVDRSIAFGIALILVSAVLWVCKMVFHSPSGSAVSEVLFQVFSIFGGQGSRCIVPAIIAVVGLYVLRIKLIADQMG